ncbi:MAG: SpoIIE family protein phosphatase [Bacteroidales bacterium]|nr:SpoIIE family protein phosphatase [Bacteroidales bacterium]
MPAKKSFTRLKQYSFKLNSLLEITQAINSNLPIPGLLNKYRSILQDELNIGKIIIYKLNDKWESILAMGISDKDIEDIDVARDLVNYKEITFVTSSPNKSLSRFDIIIPVITQDTPLAFVLIGDIDEEGEGVSPTIKHLHFIQTLSNVIIVAIENIRLFNESLQQEAMKKELELASRMQNMLIPADNKLPSSKNIHVKAFYHPHFEVGGDYYDCLALSEHDVGFCIADVSGKGISAAILMSNFQANLKVLFRHGTPLPQLVEELNQRVMESANGEKFITLFIGQYNSQTRKLDYINAGHNPPLLYEKKKKELMLLGNGCVGMGMLDKIPVIETGHKVIEEPTKILCYTDGLVELVDEDGVEFGTKNIERLLQNSYSIAKNIDEIIVDQKILTGSTAIFDDITILGLELIP